MCRAGSCLLLCSAAVLLASLAAWSATRPLGSQRAPDVYLEEDVTAARAASRILVDGAAELPVIPLLVDADPAMTALFGLDLDDNLAIAHLLASYPTRNTSPRRPGRSSQISSAVRVLGVSVCHGNAGIAATCRDAKEMMADVVADPATYPDGAPPVACGSGFLSDYRQQDRSNNEAVALLVDTTLKYFRETGERVTWVALGALTNIAAALYAHPEVAPAIERIVMMGGNVDGTFALNTSVDPDAAEEVLAADVPKMMVAHNLCKTVAFSSADANKWLDPLRPCRDAWITSARGRGWVDAVHQHAARFGRFRYVSPWQWAELLGLRTSEVTARPKESLKDNAPVTASGFQLPVPAARLAGEAAFYPWDVVAAAAVTDANLFSRWAWWCARHNDSWTMSARPCEPPTSSAGQHSHRALLPMRIDSASFVEVMISRQCNLKAAKVPTTRFLSHEL